MGIEQCRKDAKRLLRAFKVGDRETSVRVDSVLGERARVRFLLSDAQFVIAVERGYRSWPDLLHAVEPAGPGRPPGAIQSARSETVIDTGMEYCPGDPVLVRVVRRAHRITIRDDGAAVERAGRPPGWRQAVDRVTGELVVNVSRGGVVWLPVVSAGPCEQSIVRRIGEASLDLYQEILELV